MGHRSRVVAGVLVLGLAGSPGCARTTPEDDAPFPTPAATSPTSVPSTPTPVQTPVASAPLTGLPATEAVRRRAVLAVPVVSEPGGPRPVGLDRADMVFEELTTPVRYVALFQSRDAAQVGPIGQTRPTDPMLLAVARPLVAYAGGSPAFVGLLLDAPVTDLGYLRHPSSYDRSDQGIFAATPDLYRLAPTAAAAPPLLSFGMSGEPIATTQSKAAQVVVRTPGRSDVVWRYDARSRRWLRTLPSGVVVGATNLVLQDVAYKQVRLYGNGPYVPSARVLGKGTSTVLSGAAAARGSWYKPSPQQLTNYVDAAQTAVRVAPGTSWVVLLPPGSTTSIR